MTELETTTIYFSTHEAGLCPTDAQYQAVKFLLTSSHHVLTTANCKVKLCQSQKGSSMSDREEFPAN